GTVSLSSTLSAPWVRSRNSAICSSESPGAAAVEPIVITSSRRIPGVGLTGVGCAPPAARSARLRSPFDGEPEADVPGGAVGLGRASRVDAVAAAVGGVAEVRPAPHHPVGAVGGPPGVVHRAGRVVAGVEPVGDPLPHVAGHLVEAEAVRWEAAY